MIVDVFSVLNCFFIKTFKFKVLPIFHLRFDENCSKYVIKNLYVKAL